MQEVTLVRKGALYAVTPWVTTLEPLLTYTHKTFDYLAKKNKMKFEEVCLFTKFISKDTNIPSALVPAGLLTRMLRALKGAGVRCIIEDDRDIEQLMPVPDFSRVSKLRDGQDEVLKAVATHDGGIIVGATGLGKSFLIRQICKMYPTLKIVITSPRKSVVATLYDELRKEDLAFSEVGRIDGTKKEKDRRITVVTTKSLLHAPIKECDLLLFDEVHGVGRNQVGEHLAYVQHARKFGFTATPKGRCDSSELEIEALFGPVLVDITYREAQSKGMVTPIKVLRYRVSGDIFFKKEWSPVTKKRWGYWRNRTRNYKIAEIARAIPEDEQVLIMVETLEHAIYLHKMLPDFEVVHYGGKAKKQFIANVSTAKYTLSEKRATYLRHAFAKGTIKKIIATTTWREGKFYAPHARKGMLKTLLIAGNSYRIVPGTISSEGFKLYLTFLTPCGNIDYQLAS